MSSMEPVDDPEDSEEDGSSSSSFHPSSAPHNNNNSGPKLKDPKRSNSNSKASRHRRSRSLSPTSHSTRSSLNEASSVRIRGGGSGGWDARRRSPRVNGADIYVARFTKNGVGPAKPCWRCLEWCRWAGVKRVFHWDGKKGCFEVVKVNEACGQLDTYETHADLRLYNGLGW